MAALREWHAVCCTIQPRRIIYRYARGGRGGNGESIGLSTLSVEDFQRLSDDQLDALEARLLVKYGNKGKAAQSPPEQPKMEL